MAHDADVSAVLLADDSEAGEVEELCSGPLDDLRRRPRIPFCHRPKRANSEIDPACYTSPLNTLSKLSRTADGTTESRAAGAINSAALRPCAVDPRDLDALIGASVRRNAFLRPNGGDMSVGFVDPPVSADIVSLLQRPGKEKAIVPDRTDSDRKTLPLPRELSPGVLARTSSGSAARLLYPDSPASSSEDDPATLFVSSLQLADKSVSVPGECGEIEMTVLDSGVVSLRLSFVDGRIGRMMLDSGLWSVRLANHGGWHNVAHYMDFYYRRIPPHFSKCGLLPDAVAPILRVTLRDRPSPQLVQAVTRVLCPLLTTVSIPQSYDRVTADYVDDQRRRHSLSSDPPPCTPHSQYGPRRSNRVVSRQAESAGRSPRSGSESADVIIGQAVCPDLPDKPETLFVYPESGVGPVTITSADSMRLEPGVYLNDSLVDFDLRYQYEHLDDALRARVLILSSFFYRRLLDEGPTGVRSWTEELGLFGRDFVFVPICEHLHWYLAVICHPRCMLLPEPRARKTGATASDAVELSDGESGPGGLHLHTPDSDPDAGDRDRDRLCKILIFDSLGSARPATLSRLKSFLQDEASHKLRRSAVRERAQGVNVRCPRQTNYYDCGLFCCQYVEAFLSDPDTVIGRAQEHGLVAWFPESLAGERRQRLRDLIGVLMSTLAYRPPSNDPGNSSDIEEIICLD